MNDQENEFWETVKKSGSARIYQDSEGNDCSLNQMAEREPEWLLNRFRWMENKIAHSSKPDCVWTPLENCEPNRPMWERGCGGIGYYAGKLCHDCGGYRVFAKTPLKSLEPTTPPK